METMKVLFLDSFAQCFILSTDIYVRTKMFKPMGKWVKALKQIKWSPVESKTYQKE